MYGDEPVAGARTGQLTVRSMIEQLRRFSDEYQGHAGRFRAGVTTRLRPLPAWKQEADFLFVQVSFDVDALLAWRDTVPFDGDVYAGVMVLPSVSMARKPAAAIPEIDVPVSWLGAIESDRGAGVESRMRAAHPVPPRAAPLPACTSSQASGTGRQRHGSRSGTGPADRPSNPPPDLARGRTHARLEGLG